MRERSLAGFPARVWPHIPGNITLACDTLMLHYLFHPLTLRSSCREVSPFLWSTTRPRRPIWVLLSVSMSKANHTLRTQLVLGFQIEDPHKIDANEGLARSYCYHIADYEPLTRRPVVGLWPVLAIKCRDNRVLDQRGSNEV